MYVHGRTAIFVWKQFLTKGTYSYYNFLSCVWKVKKTMVNRTSNIINKDNTYCFKLRAIRIIRFSVPNAVRPCTPASNRKANLLFRSPMSIHVIVTHLLWLLLRVFVCTTPPHAGLSEAIRMEKYRKPEHVEITRELFRRAGIAETL